MPHAREHEPQLPHCPDCDCPEPPELEPCALDEVTVVCDCAVEDAAGTEELAVELDGCCCCDCAVELELDCCCCDCAVEDDEALPLVVVAVDDTGCDELAVEDDLAEPLAVDEGALCEPADDDAEQQTQSDNCQTAEETNSSAAYIWILAAQRLSC